MLWGFVWVLVCKMAWGVVWNEYWVDVYNEECIVDLGVGGYIECGNECTSYFVHE